MATADVVVVELQAKVDKYNASLVKASGEFKARLAEMQVAALSAGNAMAIPATKAADAFGKVKPQADRAATAIKGVGGQVGQLGAQFNDIAVQLAGGQSPLLIAVQQGTQISQALGQAGAGGAVNALKGAFVGLLNPVGLLTVGLIAATGYAVQYFAELLSGGEDANLTLKQQVDIIRKVADRWGDAVPAIKAYADELDRVQKATEGNQALGVALADQFKQAQQALGPLYEELLKTANIGVRTPEGRAFGRAFYELNQASQELSEAYAKGNATTKQFENFQSSLSNFLSNQAVPATGSLKNAILDLALAYNKMADAAARARLQVDRQIEAENGMKSFGGNGRRYRLALPDSAPTPSMLGPGDVGADSSYRSSGDDPKGYLATRAINARIADRIEALDNEFAKALAEVLAQFPELQIVSARRTTAEQKAIYDSGVRPAAKPGNSLHEKGLAVDLGLRAGGLPPPAVLKAIYAAARQAGIEFPVKNDPFHAQPIGAKGFAAGQAGTTTEKTPSELFAGDRESLIRRTEILNAEYAAQAKLNPLVEDYGFEVAKAKEYQDLLNDAKRRGIELTDQEKEGLLVLAGNYAKASAARNQLTQAQQDAAQAARDGSEFGKEVLGGFIQDLIHGKSAAEALSNALAKVADRLLEAALNSAFGLNNGGNGTGGPLSFLGTLLGGLFRAKGGPVRKGQPYIVGEKRPELFVPDSNGTIVPRVPNVATPSRSGSQSSGGTINAHVTSEFIGGSIVPTMIEVAGTLDGRQIKQVTKIAPARIAQSNARGV